MEDDVDGSDPLVIVYTSGSTGAPKGVVHTHASLLEHQMDLNEIRGLTAGRRLFSNSPFFWIGGFAFSLLGTLLAGATLVCSNATDAGETLDLLERERPTMVNGFAPAVAHLARGSDRSRARDLSLDPARQPLADHAGRRATRRSRTAAQHARHDRGGQRRARQRRRNRSARAPARVVRQARARLRGRGRRPRLRCRATGEVGELWIRGPFLMQRYYKREPRRVLRRRRLVPHRRSRAHRRTTGSSTSSAGAAT